MEKEVQIKNLEELQTFAKSFLQNVSISDNQATVVALVGDLGAGKTAFVQALGKELGVTEHITSPTFTIMRQYPIEHADFDLLVHIDAYRIEDKSELGPLRIKELLQQPKTLVCIEWPTQLGITLPAGTTQMQFAINSDESRTVQVTAL